jgi:hypothetical protein
MNRAYDRTDGWRDSADICALCGEDRHLGHIVRSALCWIAFDATHLNDTGNAIRILGTFRSISEAKAAVESASRGYLTARSQSLPM